MGASSAWLSLLSQACPAPPSPFCAPLPSPPSPIWRPPLPFPLPAPPPEVAPFPASAPEPPPSTLACSLLQAATYEPNTSDARESSPAGPKHLRRCNDMSHHTLTRGRLQKAPIRPRAVGKVGLRACG